MRTVGELIQGQAYYTANSDQSVYEIARYMAEKDIGAVPILQDNRLVGIFSERDIIKRVIVAGKDVRTTSLKEVMTTELVVAQSTEEVTQVLEKMQKNRCRHMPVVIGDRLAGFLSLRDLLSADLEEKDAQVQQLNTYVYYSP
ncbi:MAG: IMP dehydrogenase [Acidobacteria bacterium]|nr:MAG: IMP dehydrogenase [Acidobacteriota bacterium]